MMSRLTAHAAAFAVLATASLAYAAGAQRVAVPTLSQQPHVVQLERVVVTAKRLPLASR